MINDVLFNLFGGLGLLIYGIHLMGVGLRRYAGDKMKTILAKVISNRFKGVLVGTGVTAIIQSSSATSVLVIGFVSAGLMTLTQAISVIFGANIGTTITGQLIAFKLTKYALPIITLGAVMYLFSKSKKKDLGEAILGFGILFLGLSIMTNATKYIKDYPFVADMFVAFSHNPFLGLLAGFLLTVLIQSSSATIGILIALASTGVVDLSGAIPIIMGDNIGTCTTALIASISSSIHAKRAALSHLMFNVLGTIVGFVLLPFYILFMPIITIDIVRQIANTHTIFNILNVIIFLPFIPLFVKLLEKILPEKAGDAKGPIYLEKKLLKTPSIAIISATKEIGRMTAIVKEMLELTIKDFTENKLTAKAKVLELEEHVDELQDEITDYLVELTQQKLDKHESKKIPELLHIVNDLERIGDHAVNLIKLTEKKIETMTFSKLANEHVLDSYNLSMSMINDSFEALEDNKAAAKRIIRKEDELNILTKKYKKAHIKRLEKGSCDITNSITFMDFLKNFERIGDHLTNVAEAKLEIWDSDK